MVPADTPYGRFALGFAEALVSGEFSVARSMLSRELSESVSASDLQTAYQEMIEYGDGPPDEIEVMNVLSEWPEKLPTDLGWAYVAIGGPGYAEAVAVVVTREGKVRKIEWRRP